MTDSEYVEDQDYDYVGQGAAIPVHIASSGVPREVRVPPEYGSCMTWQIGTTGQQPTQILQRRERRFKAKISIVFPGAGNVILSNNINHLSVPQGYTATASAAGVFNMPDWESQQPLYAIASITGVTVSVIDESYES